MPQKRKARCEPGERRVRGYELLPSLPAKGEGELWSYSVCADCRTTRRVMLKDANLAVAFGRSLGRCSCGGKLNVERIKG